MFCCQGYVLFFKTSLLAQVRIRVFQPEIQHAVAGYAFVFMKDSRDGDDAIRKLDGYGLLCIYALGYRDQQCSPWHAASPSLWYVALQSPGK